MSQAAEKIRGPLGQSIFWFLFLGVIVLIGLSAFLGNLFVRYEAQHVSRPVFKKKVDAAIGMLRTSLPAQYPEIVTLLKEPGLHVKIEKHAPQSALRVTNQLSAIEAMTRFEQERQISAVALQLANNQWLVMRTFNAVPTWIIESRVISAVLILGLSFLLCYGIFFSFMMPLKLIVLAARRLATDWEAPRLARVGSASMRAVIGAFNHMQRQVQKLMKARSRMLAAISHDLRTPITRLQLRAEYIEDRNQYEKTLEDLSEMESMIQSILAFSRESDHSEPKEVFDLSALLQSTVDDLTAMGKPVEMSEIEARIEYFGRVNGLRRVFTNVIENAIKYGHEASVEFTDSEHDWHIWVTDKGKGIPEDDFSRVFEPFYRCDTARTPKVGGSGLGLAVVKDIVSAHGGEVRLRNLPEGGLQVEVRLPKSGR